MDCLLETFIDFQALNGQASALLLAADSFWMNPKSWWAMAQVVLGLGFVIFVHELIVWVHFWCFDGDGRKNIPLHRRCYSPTGCQCRCSSAEIRSASTARFAIQVYFRRCDNAPSTSHQPAESFKALRTSIFFKAKQERGLKVIQVTSPTPGDGKSVVTANLAVVMAQSGRRILLIDCDLRRQTQHLRFGVPSTTGVTSILAGESTLDDATQSTGVENLRILAAGPPCGNPAEMLTTKSFGRLIAEAREKYDFVLIDTPPVLPVTDPVIISSHVDAVYMPMRIRKGVQVKSQKAVEALALVGRQIEGVVINGLSRKEAGSYGFGGYGNTYAAYGAYGTYGTHNAPAIPTLGKAATLGSFAADDGPSRNGNSARPTATQGKPSTANPKKVTGTASIVNNGTANLHRGHRNGNGKGRVKVASHTRKNEPTS